MDKKIASLNINVIRNNLEYQIGQVLDTYTEDQRVSISIKKSIKIYGR